MHYFPEFRVSLRGAICFRKSAPFQAGPFFYCMVSGENQRHQDSVKTFGYWKTCFKLEKMAEK